MNTLVLPVRIARRDARYLYLEAQNPMDTCEKCARGEGCGARPWFRGLFKANTPLRLAHDNQPHWQENDLAALHLPAAILTRIAALTYGAPLAAFMLALFLTRAYHEGTQLLFALILAAASLLPARYYGEHLLKRHLHLRPPANPETHRPSTVYIS